MSNQDQLPQEESAFVPTINQLVRKGRTPKQSKIKSPAMRKNWNSLKTAPAAHSGRAAEARCVHPGAHNDPQEAELGAAQDRPRAVDQPEEVTAYIPGNGHSLQEHSSS